MMGGDAMARPYRRAAEERKGGMDETASITVNGEHRRVPKGISVADLALELGLEPTKVAVERNLEIVPRSTLAQVAGRGRRRLRDRHLRRRGLRRRQTVGGSPSGGVGSRAP